VTIGRLARERSGTEGAALLELLLATVMVVSLAGMAVPLTAQAADDARARAAANYLAHRVRQARQQAVAGNRAAALLFDEVDGRWATRTCIDGNGNGVRRAEVWSGPDSCPDAAPQVDQLFPGTRLVLPADIPDLDAQTGDTRGVRFGPSAMASCTPLGHCTPGTFYVRSMRGQQYAVRVSGTMGRTRVLRFDAGTRHWTTN
jgi:type II secretory pathway pseudopilin PulG